MEKTVVWPGWETVRLIGRGSFGAVYEIQRTLFDEVEKAALKVISIPQNDGDIEEMRSDGYDEESITSTFQNHLKSIVAEYSLMRKMNGSANVVNCDDVRYIQHNDGMGWDIYIKMELLTPLTKALPGDIPEETVIRLGVALCSALALCKKFEIVHRDIKPQNIFVSENGDFKLGDFGIAKTVEKTMSGTKIGTYKYMAPEVYNNQPYGSAADIYSLGLVLYWMLNERRMPFLPLPPTKLSAGMDEAARTRRLSGEPLPAPKHGSPELKRIVLKACAYNPCDRYADPQQMREELMALGQRDARTPENKEERPADAAENSQPAEDATVIIPAPQPAEPSHNHQAASSRQAENPPRTEESGNRVSSAPVEETSKPESTPEPATKPSPVPGKRKLLLPAAAVLVFVIGGFCWLLFGKLLPEARYSKAVTLLENGEYEEAIAAFEALNGYQDSAQLLETARLEFRYLEATDLLASERYEEAIAALEALDGYRDSAQLLEAARLEFRYLEAADLLAAERYEEAIAAFEALGDYRDSAKLLESARLEFQYMEAIDLLASERYEEAIAAFEALGNYRDSSQQLEAARYAIQIIDLKIKTTYCLGEILTSNSLGLTAVYGSGKERAATDVCACSPAVLNKAGTQEVTVIYKGITKTFSVEVLDFFELEVEVRNVNGAGYNESARVNWILYVTARYNGNYVEYAYEHNMPTSYGFVDFPEMWEKAKEGKETEWHYGHASSDQFGQYHAGGAVALPDDPSFAGRYSATVFFGDVSKTVTFTLTYKGDYTSGTGWEVSDIIWE